MSEDFSLMKEYIALFVIGRKSFFKEKARTNCSIYNYMGCDGADVLFDLEGVMEKEIVDMGDGVEISQPLKVERGLMSGDYIYASLSHQGVFAIYINGDIVQFTDFNNNRQVRMSVEDTTHVGFYDDKMLLLTLGKPLREATVESVFDNPTIKTFNRTGKRKRVTPYTDVSLLQARRVLYYSTTNYKLFTFNVDTKVNTKINVKEKVSFIASFTGIDCGAKAVFCSLDTSAYILNMDDSVTTMDEKPYSLLTVMFPSNSNPYNINDAGFKCFDIIEKNRKMLNTRNLIRFDGHCSVVRIYRDIFLSYDKNTNSWVLINISII